MTSPPQDLQSRSGLRGNAGNFWNRVTEGLAVNQLWSQLVKDTRSSYRLYSADLDDQQTERSRRRRVWRNAKALFWAILEKLTPARRVLVLLGLILLFFPSGTSFIATITGMSMFMNLICMCMGECCCLPLCFWNLQTGW